jgi:hypothetical protein
LLVSLYYNTFNMCAFYSGDEYEHLGRSEMTARPASSLGLWPLPPGSLASSEGFLRLNAPVSADTM